LLIIFDDDCWAKVWFKNTGCTSAVIYRKDYGKWIYYTKLKQNENWAVTSQKGTEWGISDGQSIKKKWHVSSCYTQTVEIDFGGCHDYSYSCQTRVTFKNHNCKKLQIYWDNEGQHVHFKDLDVHGHWTVTTRKGHKWLIKDGHTIKKRWTVLSCSDNQVTLDFGGCSYDHSECQTKVVFKNHHCKDLKIYWNNNGHHVHYKTLAANSYWSISTKKGYEWIIKEGNTIKKRWVVNSCEEQSITLKFGSCYNDHATCDSKIIFKNDHCAKLSIYRKDNGHYVHHKDISPGYSWSSHTQKGHDWIIKEGHIVKKQHHVTTCSDHTVKLEFGGCHDYQSSSCITKVTFKNHGCNLMSIYWNNNGQHVHYKDLDHNRYWTVTTRKGHKWIIKEGHTVKKNWTVTSCSEQTLKLDFGGCSYGYTACSSKVGFINKNCHTLSIYWNDGGTHKHLKELKNNSYWRVNTRKGHEWIIKHNGVIKKKWTVSHCSDYNLNLNFGGCDDLCSDGSKKEDPGTYCDDYNDKTENDVIQADGCSCEGTEISSSGSDECEVSNDDYEKNWGNWYDGGSDCKRHYSTQNHMYGDYSIALRNNNGWASSTYSSALKMHGHSSIKVEFAYKTEYLNKNEAFALEFSTNDGKTWYKVKKWYKDVHFSNDKMYHESLSFTTTLSDRTRFRFRCYASSANNHVYLDNVKISSCEDSHFTSNTGKDTFGKSKVLNLELVNELVVFPNPVQQRLQVSGLSDQERYTIYALDGRAVINSANVSSLDVSRLESGTYFIRTEHGNTTKFIKQ